MAKSKRKDNQERPLPELIPTPKVEPQGRPPETEQSSPASELSGDHEPRGLPNSQPDQSLANEPTIAITTPRTLLTSISLESLLYALFFAVSLSIRFVDLGSRPLTRQEAEVAMSAWQFLQGQGSGFRGPPFIFNTDLLLFFLGGATDTTVRVFPAILGSAVVLLPCLIRHELGRWGALVTSGLLVFSPTLVFFARVSSGAEIGVTAGLAATILVYRYREFGNGRALVMGMILAAVSLTASAAGWLIIVAAVAFSFLTSWVGNRANEVSQAPQLDPLKRRVDSDELDRTAKSIQIRNAGLTFVGSFIAFSTALTWNRGGMAAAFDLPGAWIASFGAIGPLQSPLNLLPIYEPLGLVFGAASLPLLLSLGRVELKTRGLLLFFGSVLIVGGLLESVSSDKSPENVVVIVVPLTILAGWLIGNFLERTAQDMSRAGGRRVLVMGELPLFILSAVLATLVFLQLATLLQQNRFSPNIEAIRQLISGGFAPGEFETALILLGVFTLAIAAFLAFLGVGLIGQIRTGNFALFFLFGILAVSEAHVLSLANFSSTDIVNELIEVDQTSLQTRDLVDDLEWLSVWRVGDPHLVPIVADQGLSPVVHWYLRDFKNVTWVRQPQINPDGEAYVTTAQDPPPPGVWISQQYRLEMDWQPRDLTGENLWKWLLFRNGGALSWQSVKLWAPVPE